MSVAFHAILCSNFSSSFLRVLLLRIFCEKCCFVRQGERGPDGAKGFTGAAGDKVVSRHRQH